VIKIEITDANIRFYCRNAKRELTETEQKMDKGIGIGNIRRRLDLLYPGRYTLEISDGEGHFTVSLIIQINENQLYRN
jgi:two-component system, LytTR family, sensor kinase